MPRIPYPGFCGPSYVAKSPLTACEELINFIVEGNRDPNAQSRYSLLPTPGVVLLSTLAKTSCRGTLSVEGLCYAVYGDTFYQINNDYSATSWGTVAVNANPATLSYNGDGGRQVFVTSGRQGYLFDVDTHAFTQVLTDSADIGDFLDTFFLAFDATTGTMRMSDSLDGLTWDPTQEWQRGTFADPWKGFIVTPNRQILLFGQYTSELWGNTGASPIPFELISGGTFQQGIKAPYSAKRVGGTVMWIAATENGESTVQKLTGYSPEQVSTPPIDVFIKGLSKVDDGDSMSYELEGHLHWVVNFPGANRSLGYDLTEGLWNKRGTWNSMTADYDIWHAQSHVVFNGVDLAFDRFTGGIYQLSTDLLLDFSAGPVRRLRIPPMLPSKNLMLIRSRLEIYGEMGLATSPILSDPGATPTVMLRSSKNGGKTWNALRTRTFGTQGDYGHRCIYGTMPAGRKCVDELTMADPAPWRITDAYITLSQGLN